MLSYQDRKSHCDDKTAVASSYTHNGISYTDKMVSLYWISPQQYIVNAVEDIKVWLCVYYEICRVF